MKNKKLLFILIPIILVVLILIAGVIFLKLNSAPRKIFKNSISKVFEMTENTGEKYTTMKGTMNFTANIESDNEQIQAMNEILQTANIGLNMEADTKQMIVNENLNVTINNQNLLNATLLLQDQKGYVYLQDWLDKYLELSEEYLEYSDLVEYSEKMDTLDQNKLMEAIKEELVKAILKQDLSQEKVTLNLNGEETKVTASTLSLKDEAITTFTREFLSNLRENEKFQTALGAYKEEAQNTINEMLESMTKPEENSEFIFTIYTKGLLNKFVGLSAKAIDGTDGEIVGLDIWNYNKEKYELVAYNEYNEERENAIKLVIENKKENKNKGTSVITIEIGGEEFTLTYNYEKQGKQTNFEAATEIEGVKVSILGNVTENGKNYKGKLTFAVEQQEFGKINLNCDYDLTYGVDVQKVDVQNAVLIDELSEEDQEELMTNLQNSPLYQIIEQSGMLESGTNPSNTLPEVKSDGYTVKYNVPNNFEVSEFSSDDLKMYTDEDLNSISVYINNESVDTYIKDLEKEYVYTSTLYKNQQISEAKTYKVNDKEYKFRTITYSDEYGSYVNLYFAYKLDDENCYVVEVETEDGNISMDTVKYFLDVTVD